MFLVPIVQGIEGSHGDFRLATIFCDTHFLPKSIGSTKIHEGVAVDQPRGYGISEQGGIVKITVNAKTGTVDVIHGPFSGHTVVEFGSQAGTTLDARGFTLVSPAKFIVHFDERHIANGLQPRGQEQSQPKLTPIEARLAWPVIVEHCPNRIVKPRILDVAYEIGE